jgi:phosphate transport system substrate-binding protein
VTFQVFNTATAKEILRNGEADLGLLSWLQQPGGGGQPLWTDGFARDGIAVIVHPDSPLTEIGLAQLREIFRGRLQEWDGVVLTVVSREDGSGTRTALERMALGGEETTLNAVVVPSSEAMVEYVASTPGAIGYVSTWRLDERVRELPLGGVRPTEQTISDGSYPLWRQLHLASSGEPAGEARQFAQWLLQGGGSTRRGGGSGG